MSSDSVHIIDGFLKKEKILLANIAIRKRIGAFFLIVPLLVWLLIILRGQIPANSGDTIILFSIIFAAIGFFFFISANRLWGTINSVRDEKKKFSIEAFINKYTKCRFCGSTNVQFERHSIERKSSTSETGYSILDENHICIDHYFYCRSCGSLIFRNRWYAKQLISSSQQGDNYRYLTKEETNTNNNIIILNKADVIKEIQELVNMDLSVVEKLIFYLHNYYDPEQDAEVKNKPDVKKRHLNLFR